MPSRALLRAFVASYSSCHAFVCGPSPFMETVTLALRDCGVPPARIHIERIQSLAEGPAREGLKAPSSCRQGACSACTCILDEGEVKMLTNEILEREDLDSGYLLGCQSVPLSDTVRIRYG